jgi:hypothetical protein
MKESLVTLVYAGRRDIESNTYYYYEPAKDTYLLFSRKIYDVSIGVMFQCTRTETGVKAPYTILPERYDNKDMVLQWTAEDEARVQRAKVEAAVNKTLPDSIEFHIQAIIDASKNLSWQAREAVALRVYTRVMRSDVFSTPKKTKKK